MNNGNKLTNNSVNDINSGNFNTIIRNILKDQNKDLLHKIAIKYNKTYEDLERKYLTPSFYSLDLNTNKIYDIEISTSSSKITK
jgi:hypothetical protein